MKRLVILLATTALLIAVPAAQAGEPFTIGEGDSPHLLVDPDGTAHVAWSNAVTDRVHYCQVPRGATTCSRSIQFAPGFEPGTVFLVREGANLHIAMGYNATSDTYLWTTADNGATWSSTGAPLKVYDFGDGRPADMLAGPQAGQFTVASFNPGINVWAPSFTNAEQGSTAHASLPSGSVSSLGYDIQVAPTTDGGLVAVANNLANLYFWRMNPGLDPSVTGNWSTEPVLIAAGGDSAVAGGSSGTFIMANDNSAHVEILAWNGGGFTPVFTANENPYINDITVGPAGGVAAVWRRNGAPNTMRFALSTDGGATFGIRNIVYEDVVMADMDVALANDNEGWVVYEGTNAESGAKRFIRLASTADITPPATQPPTTTPPTTTPPTFSGPFRPVNSTVNGATITFTVPRTCVQPGQKFRVTLKWKRKKRKGNLFVKVRRADFYIGTRRVKIDRKAPFVQTLTATATAPRGSKITLRARAFIKVKRGKSPTKSIRTSITVCTS